MVHAIEMLKCNKGHILPITFDSNECGCHHDGKPCIILMCDKCYQESLKNIDDRIPIEDVTIPLDKDGMKEINKLRTRRK